MNYYQDEYATKQHPIEKKMIALADEILTLYFSGKKDNKYESIKKTDEFIKEYLNLIQKNEDKLKKENKRLSKELRDFKMGLSKQYSQEVSIHKIEAELVARRIENVSQVDEIGFLHNVLFVSWSLEILGIKQREVINDTIHQELHSPLIYNLVDTSNLDLRRRIFIRNAKRAEQYSHHPIKDMYTPLILSRMAIEQCIKLLHEEKIGPIPKVEKINSFGKKREEEMSVADITKVLTQNKIISSYFSEELSAVRRRGNANTHYGEADYPFAVIHGLHVLNKLYNDLIK